MCQYRDFYRHLRLTYDVHIGAIYTPENAHRQSFRLNYYAQWIKFINFNGVRTPVYDIAEGNTFCEMMLKGLESNRIGDFKSKLLLHHIAVHRLKRELDRVNIQKLFRRSEVCLEPSCSESDIGLGQFAQPIN